MTPFPQPPPRSAASASAYLPLFTSSAPFCSNLRRLSLLLFLPLLSSLASTSHAASSAEPTTIPLWPEGMPDLRPDADADAAPEENTPSHTAKVHHPSLTVFPASADKTNGTAVIVCPGGGYVRLSFDKEGTEIAAWLNARGVTAFVLKYRLAEYGHPAPLRDVLRAIRTVRSRSAEFAVFSDRIGILGFSAGGHLASCAATLHDAPEGKTGAALDTVSARPDFAALIYPVITMKDPFAHAGSRKALLGENPAPELLERFSTDQHVTATTPPTFLLHTTEDKTVPVENALAFYAALKRHNVPAELHVFEKGPHGIGMRPGHGPASDWPVLLEGWLRLHGWIAAASHAL